MEDTRKFILESRSLSGLGTVALIVIIGAGILSMLLVPVVTGISLGVPMKKLEYNIQAVILQGDTSPPRAPSN